MIQHCATCFNAGQYLDEADVNNPCRSCVGFDKWVSRDFLNSVPDTPMKTAWFIKPDSDKDGYYDALRYGAKASVNSPKPITLKTGVKFDQEKPQWTLVPFKAFDHVVEVLTIGAKKYAPDNWKKVPNARQRYIDAAFRHMSAYAGGEKLDAETGKNHLAHAVCCLLFLLAFDLDSSLEKTND